MHLIRNWHGVHSNYLKLHMFLPARFLHKHCAMGSNLTHCLWNLDTLSLGFWNNSNSCQSIKHLMNLLRIFSQTIEVSSSELQAIKKIYTHTYSAGTHSIKWDPSHILVHATFKSLTLTFSRYIFFSLLRKERPNKCASLCFLILQHTDVACSPNYYIFNLFLKQMWLPILIYLFFIKSFKLLGEFK